MLRIRAEFTGGLCRFYFRRSRTCGREASRGITRAFLQLNRGVKLSKSIKSNFIFCLLLAGVFVAAPGRSHTTNANLAKQNAKKAVMTEPKNVMDELDPFAPDIDQKLEEFDRVYEQKTNKAPWLREISPLFSGPGNTCYRDTCKVFAYIRRSDQKLYLSIDGNPYAEWAVSTGAPGHDTPDFDRHPNGRIYDQYSSATFPGGNYQGLGNMPYAVFIQGGFAVHGTGKSNWKRLGTKASHGCIRLHPDNALTFNRLVRQYGVSNVWIQVTE